MNHKCIAMIQGDPNATRVQNICRKRTEMTRLIYNKPGSNLPGGLQNDQAFCDKPDYFNSPTTYISFNAFLYRIGSSYDLVTLGRQSWEASCNAGAGGFKVNNLETSSLCVF
ncbi:hypothetical protein AVEN_96054-1 [Araneus ventricosus]|uniref:Uncharacterized protein n=1 Tax=Araneus ventricosus TaxID=182803 RepID=A0A4Y2B3A7_ARAVE|nr:hypothetical protein AVEN_96054-1 [Araneus ventricosus]